MLTFLFAVGAGCQPPTVRCQLLPAVCFCARNANSDEILAHTSKSSNTNKMNFLHIVLGL